MNKILNGTTTTIFGDESIEARKTGLAAIGDFIDAVDEAFKDCHDIILSNCLTGDRDDIERDVMEWTGEIKKINDLLGKAYKLEQARLHSDEQNSPGYKQYLKDKHREQQQDEARLEAINDQRT